MKLIKELREKKHLTQKEVADYLGITRVAYTQYELGKRSPDHGTIVKLANLFSVSTDYILGNTEDPTPPGIKKSPSLEELLNDNEELKTIYNLYSSLDDEGKKKADDFLEYLLSKQEAEKEKE